MSEGFNPFQAPSSQSFQQTRGTSAWVIERVKIPAICLMVVTILSLFHRIADLILSVLFLNGTIPLPGQPAQMQSQMQIAMVVDAVAIAIGLVMLVGAWQMLQAKSYAFAMFTAILAVIPCISPCLFLGIPFGIWALVVLADEQTKANFS
jgi:hypothetical protein